MIHKVLLACSSSICFVCSESVRSPFPLLCCSSTPLPNLWRYTRAWISDLTNSKLQPGHPSLTHSFQGPTKPRFSSSSISSSPVSHKESFLHLPTWTTHTVLCVTCQPHSVAGRPSGKYRNTATQSGCETASFERSRLVWMFQEVIRPSGDKQTTASSRYAKSGHVYARTRGVAANAMLEQWHSLPHAGGP
jgi:hypothetical protein